MICWGIWMLQVEPQLLQSRECLCDIASRRHFWGTLLAVLGASYACIPCLHDEHYASYWHQWSDSFLKKPFQLLWKIGRAIMDEWLQSMEKELDFEKSPVGFATQDSVTQDYVKFPIKSVRCMRYQVNQPETSCRGNDISLLLKFAHTLGI